MIYPKSPLFRQEGGKWNLAWNDLGCVNIGTANLGAFLEEEKSEANPKCTDNKVACSLIGQVTWEPVKTVSPHLPSTPGYSGTSHNSSAPGVARGWK